MTEDGENGDHWVRGLQLPRERFCSGLEPLHRQGLNPESLLRFVDSALQPRVATSEPG
jgi:hypothetical protein